ncbi:MAG: TAT-variant-translocated molybdopterin oxidoreductase [Candidatus Binatia bacterium]
MTTQKPSKTPLDLATIRDRLSESRGPQYWRSLEELANTEEFQDLLQREFPRHAPWLDSLSRRHFLQFMGASLALAGLSACTRQPEERIVPYAKPPEDVLPGRPQFYATAVLFNGVASGVLVESHTGRPTKIEGNPQHPASLGGTDAFTQASILDLYDPDRAQIVTNARRISSWDAFTAALAPAMEGQKLKQGAGLRILSGAITSPTLTNQLRKLLQEFPQARWHRYEPAGRETVRAGAQLAFGEDVDSQYRFDKAEVILSLDADFLFSMPGSVRYARDFAAKRKVREEHGGMNRLYAAESSPSLTGSMADHRLSLRPSEIEPFARLIAKEVGVSGTQSGNGTDSEKHAKLIGALVRDLKKHQGSSLVVAGDYQPPIVHALAHAMNEALGNVGKTVVYTEPVEAGSSDSPASLQDLASDIKEGKVELLISLGGNPVYTAPADLDFVSLLEKIPFRVHCSPYYDETAEHCHWHIPENHSLESWSDARAYDGTISIIQPLIAPLYNGKSFHEVVAALVGQPSASGYDLVRSYWKEQRGEGDFERFWSRSLHDGIIADSALPAKRVSFKTASIAQQAETNGGGTTEIVFRPDPTVWDGRYANNGWLQELPKPLTKLTWDNAALISPAMAERLRLNNRDVVTLRLKERVVDTPVWIVPGHADNCVTVHLGYGRTHAGRVGNDTGFNAYVLRTADAMWSTSGVEISKAGKQYPLVSTQDHYSIEGRQLIRSGTISEYQSHPEFVHEMGEDPAPDMTLYPPVKYDGRAWGMAIDLGSCIGCNACTIACQAENNIPVVGKKQVGVGREMHWIRVDRYFSGELDNPETYHQPVPCMQCENAPCEPVCPVGATVHSKEGLNDMVYNRCVGTRYCSNNCPYKVRRFNFLLFADWDTESFKMQRNPNVSIRSRGVMEKCTYCVQRINAARITAEKEDRQIRDGEVVTACQAACPADAIVFGDINDPESQVAKLKQSHLNYGILAELNTRPRTTYLARLKNPNPEIENG